MEIKLSDETPIGLKRLCNRSLVNEKDFEMSVSECLNAGLGIEAIDKNNRDESKSDALKTAYAALTILFTEAARHDLNGYKLRTLLEGYNLELTRIVPIVNAYNKKRSDIQKRLLMIGTNVPHIVAVRWRIDFRIKSNYLGDSVIQKYILVELVTVTSMNTTEIRRFVCTPQSLQELILSLKGAARHISKMANRSN